MASKHSITIDKSEAENGQFGFGSDGRYITKCDEDGVAYAAGLRKDDKLIEVNGLNLDDFGDDISQADVASAVKSKGDKVELIIERGAGNTMQYVEKVGVSVLPDGAPIQPTPKKRGGLFGKKTPKEETIEASTPLAARSVSLLSGDRPRVEIPNMFCSQRSRHPLDDPEDITDDFLSADISTLKKIVRNQNAHGGHRKHIQPAANLRSKFTQANFELEEW